MILSRHMKRRLLHLPSSCQVAVEHQTQAEIVHAGERISYAR
jgi:hypothetical protein